MVNFASFNPFGNTITASSKIKELRVYPIKSCRGISIRSTNLGIRGLEFDRQWMFVDVNDHKFQTIRSIAELTLIDTAFVCPLDPGASGSKGDIDLVISLRNKPSEYVRIPARPTQEWLEENTTLEEVEIWGAKTDGHMYKDEVNRMFADFLGKPIALVYKGPSARLATSNGAKEHLGRDQSLNFPDMMPVLVANHESIDELNQRLKAKGQDPITIERFRPNIILEGGGDNGMAAWSEDTWKTLRIINGKQQQGYFTSGPASTIELDVGMRCARCQVPNVNPETAEKHKKEPWDTLVSYRRIDKGFKFKPCFGMLCAPRTTGPIRVGMKLEVIQTTQNHEIVRD